MKSKMRVFQISMAAFMLSFSVFSCVSQTNPDFPEDESAKVEEGADEEEQNLPELLLDVLFSPDGSAKDLSSMKKSVLYYPGPALITYYNEYAQGYTAYFGHTPGASVTSGYYKINYGGDPLFSERLSDGHSLETVFMLDSDNDGSSELKMFSSHDSGGTGIMISSASIGKDITFLPYINSGYVWTRSQVIPERGRYYHVVGVWDKEGGVSKIYVNGELKASVPAEGNLVLPRGQKWLGIGADAGSSAESAWNGEVVLARIYQGPLDDAMVRTLWKKADKEYPVSGIRIDNVSFISGCEVSGGSPYTILGSGYETGDRILLESCGNPDYSRICALDSGNGRVTFTLPEDITSGDYKLFLQRGEKFRPLGITELQVSDNPETLHAPKAIAHRCFHKNAPENSIAALSAAQDLGVYGAEIDVWSTTDGRLVVNHDGVLGGKTLQNCSYDEIKNLTLSNGETLPTLESMLEQLSKSTVTKLIIEIKDHTMLEQENFAADESVRLVKEMGLEEFVEYIAFDFETCKRIVSACPDATVGYLSGDRDPSTVYESGIKSVDYTLAVYRAHPSWIKEAHSLGMTVNMWTLNTPEEFMAAIAMGADYITTDAPDDLMEISGLFFPEK